MSATRRSLSLQQVNRHYFIISVPSTSRCSSTMVARTTTSLTQSTQHKQPHKFVWDSISRSVRVMSSSSASSIGGGSIGFTNTILSQSSHIRETIKDTILNEAIRDDSHLWKYNTTTSSIGGSIGFTNTILSQSSHIKETIKDTILNEAIRDDSHLWKYNTTSNTTTSSLNNNNNNNMNGFHPTHINGTTTTNNHQHPIINNITTVTINDSIVAPIDPLNDLYVSETPKYWPNIPPNILHHTITTISSTTTTTNDPFQLVQGELQRLSASIRNDLIGTDHPVLNQAASYFFDTSSTTDHGGKKVRPTMVLLLSRALSDTIEDNDDNTIINHHNNNESYNNIPLILSSPIQGVQRYDLPDAQRRLAEISEMIHTASLFHDDVIDGSDTRRNVPTVHTVFGNKMAILAGDYLLARASICLARLRNVDVVETMSTIIEHLVRGEVMQLRGTTTTTNSNTSLSSYNNNPINERLLYYLRKNFYKTASLMANSCKSTALLGNYSSDLVDASYKFGKHVGMAFQLVDDVLDFEGTVSQMGKPTLSDIKAGLITAPVIFAAEVYPEEMELLIQRKFKVDGDIDWAVQLVGSSDGIERTKNLARVHVEYAINALLALKPSIYRDALIVLSNKVISRTK